jgi:hypothetical protein
MSAEPILTPEQARRYLIEAFGTSREYRMYPFDLGWVVYPILSDEQISRGQHIGLTKMVLDARTRVITEFPSLPVNMVAQMYTTAIRDRTSIPGRQVYPPLIRLHLRRIQENSDTVEYLIRPESRNSPQQPTADYLLVIDKHTRLPHPPGTMTSMAASWIEARQRTDRSWPDRATIEY